MTFRKRVIRAASGSAAIKVAYLILTLGSSVVLARALGPSGFGVYSLALALVQVLAIPAQAGVPTLLVRETAKAVANGNWATVRGVWRWSTKVILLSSLVISVCASVLVVIFRDRVDAVTASTMFIGLVLVPLMALGDARGAALRGMQHIVKGQVPELIIRPGCLLLFTAAAWWATGELSASEAMTWHVLASLIGFTIGGALLWRARPKKLNYIRPDSAGAGQWRRAILPLGLIGGVQIISAQIGVLLLGVYRSESDVGLYKVAASAAAVSLFGLQISKTVAQPYIAGIYAKGDLKQLQRLSSAAALAATAVTAGVLLIFIIGGRQILEVLYGEVYVKSWQPMVILGIGQVVSAIFGSVAPLLSMTGHERDFLWWMSIAVVVNVCASLILIPIMGMNGAALAHAASILVWNIAFWKVALRRTGVDGSIIYYIGHATR